MGVARRREQSENVEDRVLADENCQYPFVIRGIFGRVSVEVMKNSAHVSVEVPNFSGPGISA